MHAFDVLGDPVRRRILELIADGELTAGAVTGAVQAEFGISQPAVSQHLRVLRESGFATVRADGTRRLYAVDAAPLQEIDLWLEQFRHFWSQRLDALGTELKRARHQQRRGSPAAVTETDDVASGASKGGRQRRGASKAIVAGAAAARSTPRLTTARSKESA